MYLETRALQQSEQGTIHYETYQPRIFYSSIIFLYSQFGWKEVAVNSSAHQAKILPLGQSDCREFFIIVKIVKCGYKT